MSRAKVSEQNGYIYITEDGNIADCLTMEVREVCTSIPGNRFGHVGRARQAGMLLLRLPYGPEASFSGRSEPSGKLPCWDCIMVFPKPKTCLHKTGEDDPPNEGSMKQYIAVLAGS